MPLLQGNHLDSWYTIHCVQCGKWQGFSIPGQCFKERTQGSTLYKKLFKFGEHGWHWLSICLPPMWPGFDSQTRHQCGLSLLLVLALAPRGFSPGTLVFPSPQKPTFPNSNSIWNPRTTLVKQRLIYFNILLHTCFNSSRFHSTAITSVCTNMLYFVQS